MVVMAKPTFEVQDSKRVAGKMVHYGPYPFTDSSRDVLGREVIVDGIERTILMMDSFAKAQPPKKGEIVGFVLLP